MQLGKIIEDQEGRFVRISSIKHPRESGAVGIKGFEDSHRKFLTHSYNARPLEPGKTVALIDEVFLGIASILEDQRTRGITLNGFRFQRAVSLDGVLEFKCHEVARIMEHNIRPKFSKNPYSNNRPVGNTLCGGGLVNYHLSGKRCVTTRELARLQRFPLHHRFGRRGTRKQTGDAVPRIGAKVFYRQVVGALRRVRGLRFD